MENTENKGLGDTVKNVFDKTGVTTAVNAITGGKDCGCKKRQEWLNERFPYD